MSTTTEANAQVEGEPGRLLTLIEREALELAARKCIGSYEVGHVLAWQRLKEWGLVRPVRLRRSSWFEPTREGYRILSQSKLP